ncbi:hypothetical protein [Halopseudomonas pelagia]|uniref:hypothetical protein n=1 Tax=Halopseudomonas pelagia TaxID=553151 RepID=UPI00039BE430|nr:hypothetical protein [Halopseudomonas pelagia]|tara:strand:- start:70886 stop:71485 length:600 start_codon:yes stop_codon:yes gene_type:complete
MAQRDPSEPSRLLKDLESIRTLLDEHPNESEQTALAHVSDEHLDVPLLQDVIVDAPGLNLTGPLTPLGNRPGENEHEAPATQPLRPKPNPFLPYDQLARLAEERVQLDRLMAGHIPPAPKPGTHTSTLVNPPPGYSTKHFGTPPDAQAGARQLRMEARLHVEAQLILQDVIDDLIPTIEAELRNRLRDKLEQMVQEQMK